MSVRQRVRQVLGYLGSGLIALFPAAVTVWIVSAIVRWLAEVFGPHSPLGDLLRPRDGSNASHLVIMAIVYCIGIGLIVLLGYGTQRRARNWVMDLVNLLFSRFPLVNRVYGALQQVANVMRSQTGGEKQAIAKFGDVVYVRYANLHGLAVLTSRRVYRILGVPHLQVFIPHSPVPATGFLYFAPVEDVTLTDLDIEDYTKIVVSFGSLTAQTVPRGMRTWALQLKGGAVEPDELPAPDASTDQPALTGAAKPKKARKAKKPPKDATSADAGIHLDFDTAVTVEDEPESLG